MTEALPEIAARYRSAGKIRGEVRRLLETQLSEIDGLVRGLLGVSGQGAFPTWASYGHRERLTDRSTKGCPDRR